MSPDTTAPNDLPDPFTPVDCDLRGMPFLPLDTVKLIESDFAAKSTPAGFKAAVLLWAYSWRQVPAGSLPADDRVLARFSGAGSRWAKLRDEALYGFILCNDNRLYHPIIADRALVAWALRLAQRKRANSGWAKDPGNATASRRRKGGTAAAKQPEVYFPPTPQKTADAAADKVVTMPTPQPPAQPGDAGVLTPFAAKVLEQAMAAFPKAAQGR